MSYLTIKQAATQLHRSEQYLRKLIREGSLKAEKVGRVWVIGQEEYVQFSLRYGMPDMSDCNFPSQNASDKPIALSFFSGAMGLDLGIEQAGFSIKLACEFDKTCQATISQNRPNLPLIGDVLNYSAEQIRKIAGVSGDIDLIVGGPPCQAFSTAGSRRGFDDARGNVFLSYIDLLLELRPKYFVIENVRGLLSASLKTIPSNNTEAWVESNLGKPGGALLYILRTLRKGGYGVTFNLYNTANYGVPQIRERVVIIGARDGSKVPYLAPSHSEHGEHGLKKWVTLREAIDGLTECHHENFPEKRLQYYRMLEPGQYWKDLPPEIQPIAMGNSYKLPGGKTGFYRRLGWDRPSCTLVTSPTMPATDICHPTENRPLSIEEYKRIQTFPDDWYLAGNLQKQYKQVGNAVPVLMGKAIGEALLRHMNGKDKTAPAGFKFSRYRNTDDQNWEKDVTERFGLNMASDVLFPL